MCSLTIFKQNLSFKTFCPGARALFLIEAFDEILTGFLALSIPGIRQDLALSYSQIERVLEKRRPGGGASEASPAIRLARNVAMLQRESWRP